MARRFLVRRLAAATALALCFIRCGGGSTAPGTKTNPPPSQPAPRIALATSTATLTGAVGASTPVAANISIANAGTGTLSGLALGAITYGAGSATGWLSATLSGTVAPATITLTARLSDLAVGTYQASVPITSDAAGIANSPQTLSVAFTVTPPPARLVLVSAPTSGKPGLVFASAFRVRAVDPTTGAPATAFTAPISATVSGTNLIGRTTVNPVAGEAVFDSLAINAIGSFTIRFSAANAIDTIATVSVASDQVGQLVARSPTNVVTDGIDSYRLNQIIEVRDANNALVGLPVQVRASVVRGVASITQGQTASSVDGLANFSPFQFVSKGSFAVAFSAPGFASATVDYNYTQLVFRVVPLFVNARDSVVTNGAVIDVDQSMSASFGQPVGSARFDVVWDPTVLSLVQDSVLVTTPGVTITRNATNATSGAYSASALSSNGIANGVRLLRLRFTVIAPASIQSRIETQSLEMRDLSGTQLIRGEVRSTIGFRVP